MTAEENNMSISSNDSSAHNQNETNSENESDDFELMLSQLDANRNSDYVSGPNSSEIIRPLLVAFANQRRQERSIDVLQYWKNESLRKPHLAQLAKIVLAVPATQVSVERLFSGLKFIMPPTRANLSSNVVDSISLIRTNQLYGLQIFK
ncbi:uncharacterized protein LOC118756567 [Rhagoletis pomonella]|uniref:uncharacterized protein LOC118756567 n=1 Tax=Rhagoletis pomonella TaxID=28610 RepID=UPI0017816154|nr:uncharacterized protein LOC118756567 [Rhagoletis pomonella]